jgi:hypothetical protein
MGKRVLDVKEYGSTIVRPKAVKFSFQRDFVPRDPFAWSLCRPPVRASGAADFAIAIFR